MEPDETEQNNERGGTLEKRLGLTHRMGMVLLALAAPRRLAGLMMRPHSPPAPGGAGWPPETEPVAFPGLGGATLRGRLAAGPAGPAGTGAEACVVVAHGWGSRALRMQMWLAPLRSLGYAVLFYDARGHGESDPTPHVSLRHFAEDVRAAVAFARQRFSRVAVLGHSLGAAATLVAMADGLDLEAAVCLAAPAHPLQATVDLLAGQGLPVGFITRRVSPHAQALAGRTFDSMAPERRVAGVRAPVLLLHGSDDAVVPAAHFHRIGRAAGPNVEAHLIAGADHATIKSDPRVRDMVSRFLRQTLPPAGASPAASATVATPGADTTPATPGTPRPGHGALPLSN